MLYSFHIRAYPSRPIPSHPYFSLVDIAGTLLQLISTRRQFPCWKEYYTKMMPQQVPGGFEEARVPASKSELQFMKHPVQNEEQEEIRKLSWFTGSF